MASEPTVASELPEFAFYYPNPMWHSGDWVKSLILYFDGVALLVPSYMTERPHQQDPAITAGLEEHGLLRILEPEAFIDQAAAERLAETMAELLHSGALEALPQESHFASLSFSRLGGSVDHGLAKMLAEELEQRGLAEKTQDGLSIPMHSRVRSLILVLLAQILRPTGREHGLELLPATDRPDVHFAVADLLRQPQLPSAGHVVALDLQTVGVDLSAVPLDEILDFRAAHGLKYRAYAREVRRVIRELGLLPEEQRTEVLRDRQEALADAAAALRAAARSAWKRMALYFALSGAGAAWAAVRGDPLGGLLGLGTNLSGAPSGSRPEAEAFSYLLAVQRQFPSTDG